MDNIHKAPSRYNTTDTTTYFTDLHIIWLYTQFVLWIHYVRWWRFIVSHLCFLCAQLKHKIYVLYKYTHSHTNIYINIYMYNFNNFFKYLYVHNVRAFRLNHLILSYLLTYCCFMCRYLLLTLIINFPTLQYEHVQIYILSLTINIPLLYAYRYNCSGMQIIIIFFLHQTYFYVSSVMQITM